MPSMLTSKGVAPRPRIDVEVWSDKVEEKHMSVEDMGTCWCDPMYYVCGDGFHVVHRQFEN